MAPVTTFVKISPRRSLPLRVFINRKSVIRQKTLFEAAISSANTVNHRALVRLKTTQRILISNKQLREFITAIKDQLLNILFEWNPEYLIMKSGTKENLKILVEVEGWSCNVMVELKFIMSLREGTAPRGMELLARQPRRESKRNTPEQQSESGTPSVPGLLREEDSDDELKIPEEGEIVKLPNRLNVGGDGADEDEKKATLKYDYRTCSVFGKGIKIELLKIPKY